MDKRQKRAKTSVNLCWHGQAARAHLMFLVTGQCDRRGEEKRGEGSTGRGSRGCQTDTNVESSSVWRGAGCVCVYSMCGVCVCVCTVCLCVCVFMGGDMKRNQFPSFCSQQPHIVFLFNNEGNIPGLTQPCNRGISHLHKRSQRNISDYPKFCNL